MKEQLNSKEGLIFLSYLTSCQNGAINYVLENYGNLTIQELAGEYDINPDSFSKIKNNNKSLIQHHVDSYENMISCIHQLEYYGVRAIAHFEKDFPDKLKDLVDCPFVIYVKGHLRPNYPMAGVVGTRSISQYAVRKTSFVVDMLNQAEFGIVSGLASGIDTIAHVQTLNNNCYTIAVMAQPLNKIFPAENYKLANAILKSGGALISELPFGISRGKADFVMRNRLQAALSRIVVPIELEVKSGTMWTVDYTKQLGRLLLLISPNKQELQFSQYEGIVHLIQSQMGNPSPSTYIIQNSSQFKDFLVQYWSDDFIRPQGTLF